MAVVSGRSANEVRKPSSSADETPPLSPSFSPYSLLPRRCSATFLPPLFLCVPSATFAPWRFNLPLFPSMFNVGSSMLEVQNLFHTSPAFTIVPAGNSAPGPMNAPAAIQQPSPISMGRTIKSNVSFRKS